MQMDRKKYADHKAKLKDFLEFHSTSFKSYIPTSKRDNLNIEHFKSLYSAICSIAPTYNSKNYSGFRNKFFRILERLSKQRTTISLLNIAKQEHKFFLSQRDSLLALDRKIRRNKIVPPRKEEIEAIQTLLMAVDVKIEESESIIKDRDLADDVETASFLSMYHFLNSQFKLNRIKQISIDDFSNGKSIHKSKGGTIKASEYSLIALCCFSLGKIITNQAVQKRLGPFLKEEV